MATAAGSSMLARRSHAAPLLRASVRRGVAAGTRPLLQRWRGPRQQHSAASSGELETTAAAAAAALEDAATTAAAAAAAAADSAAASPSPSAAGSAVSSSEEEPAAEPASHPLPDMFGAQELISELQDQETFGKRGEVWAFAELAVAALLLVPPFTLTGLVDIFATLLITAGVVFMVYGLLSLGRYVSPLPVPRKQHALVTTGMYHYLRHPQYGGLLMAAFGLAIITRSETRLAMAVLLWFVLNQKVKLEERALLDRYGEAYAEYHARVKRWVPYVV